jgi:putative nucleotidyltransferase with HDIG domain
MGVKGRILFVASEAGELAELRRRAPVLGPDWPAEFAGSASDGLQAFAREPFSVVVADLRLPGMGGAGFLQEVMARYPATIRLLLTAEEDRNEAARNLTRSHQLLAKPCDPLYLKSVLEFTYDQGRRVGNDHLRDLVARLGQLPTVPDLYRRITELCESDRGTIEELGRVIGQDPAMTAMVLKLANSAFFSLRQPVANASEAVSYLGIDLLKALVLVHGLFSQVGSFRIPTFTIQHLWNHSLAVGAGSRSIAEAEGHGSKQVNEFFTAGLLHDVGMLILASRFPEDYSRTLELNHRSGGDLESSEYHVFGATHAEVGAYLLALWGIPEPVVQAAGYHHGISHQAANGFSPALAVHVADNLCGAQSGHEVFTRVRLDQAYLTRVGLSHRLPAWRAAIRSGVG